MIKHTKKLRYSPVSVAIVNDEIEINVNTAKQLLTVSVNIITYCRSPDRSHARFEKSALHKLAPIQLLAPVTLFYRTLGNFDVGKI